MFSKDDIVARLNAGATQDEIAQEMADALNSAIAEKEAQDAKVKEQEAKDNARLADAIELADRINEFATTYYPDMFTEDFMTGQNIVDMFNATQDLNHLIFKVPNSEGKTIISTKRGSEVTNNTDQIIHDWLKNLF